jgi:hypothetical protein
LKTGFFPQKKVIDFSLFLQRFGFRISAPT